MTRYRMLAVDVDGTLVGADHRVSPAHAEAMRAAKGAGLTVCLCTGRSVGETQPVWQECNLPAPADPLICIGGAIICESDTRRTLHINPLDRANALAAADLLASLGYCVVALVDRWRWGFDYYLTEGGDSQGIWRDWFGKHECKVRPVGRLSDAPDPAELLRLTVLAQPEQAPDVESAVREKFHGKLEIVRIFAPNYGIQVIECFGANVTKWSGVTYVSQGLRIAPRDVVTVGDDVNDLPMLQKAGLGVAMGNAPEQVKSVARHAIGRHDEDGLAKFIEELLAGKYD